MESKMNILLVEDDYYLSDQIALLLKKERYKCDIAPNIGEAKRMYENNIYQLILMDWNLPDGEGITLLKEIRSFGDRVSVLMLSGRESVDERVEALDAGADDYLCKPYSNSELLARIRANLRRDSNQKSSKLSYKNLSLDLATRRVEVDGELKEISEKEFEILEFLMLNKNRAVTRYEIAELISKNTGDIHHSNIVDAHIKNIRRKLSQAQLIQTVRGVGYTIS